ncbi:MAG: outer-membrane lipoprotein carrier protein LolA [Paludibacteraceae bacterium]|nr:outer-membrane lipoprotein carrier protein LolA [Paludibacteraceae bacterium]
MKRTLFILFALLLSLGATAQTDQQAKATLDKISASLQKSAITTDFSIIYENAQTNEKEKKAGKLKLKGNKFTLSTEELELFFDGKTQWTLMKGLDEVTISEPTKEEMLQLNPILMINEFSKTHHVQFDADAEKDKQNYLLNLFPKENKFDHFKVAIVVQKETKQVKKISIKYKNGTSTTFESSNFNSAAKLTDTDFTFYSKKYPNIEINDLR